MQELDNQTEAESAKPKRGRPRKSACADIPSATPDCSAFGSVPKLTPEERRYYSAVESQDVTAGLKEFERAQAVRDSVSRKVCGSSDVVTVGDLKNAETALAAAKAALVQLANFNPILLRHPIIAVLAGTDK